ncbi:universal stress protein [Haloarcula laminariae]|uniref:universal stress protein n=1 Tax=Haloarcula laminariae TaxID=2961577 RepID=UPI0021C8F633|nr:universal stress protein [Halomicroarcula laminariae]
MSPSFFQRVVVPVANEDDAKATVAALRPYVAESDCTVIAAHVIEKAGGAPDKASVEQREQFARDVFAVVTDGLADTDIALETELLYGTEIASTLIDAAHELDASAIVFTPRGGSRWRKLLSGDVTHNLVNNSDIPILALPDREVSGA